MTNEKNILTSYISDLCNGANPPIPGDMLGHSFAKLMTDSEIGARMLVSIIPQSKYDPVFRSAWSSCDIVLAKKIARKICKGLFAWFKNGDVIGVEHERIKYVLNILNERVEIGSFLAKTTGSRYSISEWKDEDLIAIANAAIEKEMYEKTVGKTKVLKSRSRTKL